MKIQMLDDAPFELEEYFLEPEKLLSGNPKQAVWTQYCDPTGQFFAGTWSSEKGKWKISYTEGEYCQILEGGSIIADLSGVSV